MKDLLLVFAIGLCIGVVGAMVGSPIWLTVIMGLLFGAYWGMTK